ncbi:MAG: hypothetical protein KJ767_00295, partial [Nanoarchaeota archaeon]|nr:hypothetical protein [Nanoarchaeota archaeon]
ETITLLVKDSGSNSAKVELISNDKVIATQTIIVSASTTADSIVTAQPIKIWQDQPILTASVGVLILAVIVLLIWLIVAYSKMAAAAQSNRLRDLRKVREAVRSRSKRR